MPEARIAIQICELTKANGKRMVPRDVTARVFKGEVIALTAPDGEGKTEDVRFPTTTARRPNRRDEGDHHSLCAGVTAGCEVSGQSPE